MAISLGFDPAAANGTNEAAAILARVTDRERAVMSRGAFLAATDALIAEGDSLRGEPDWDRFRAWLLESDRLLESVWGRMDRYHLAWLNVGRDSAPPGSDLDHEGTRRFIAEVADAKLAVLRTMRASVERQGWIRLSDDDPADDDLLEEP
jgi:hypothetical protein